MSQREYHNGKITYVNKDEVFVFGSNLAGRHGLGAAAFARLRAGAQYGCGEGIQGRSYAFPQRTTQSYNVR